MSVALLELAAERVAPLLDEIAFLGGASLFLWIDDPGAPEPRATLDVDVIAVVNTTIGYYDLGERLRKLGFQEDAGSEVICRWRHEGLILDVMPTEVEILGFTNRWYGQAIEAAELVKLPSGREIRAVTPPYLLATKLEAFRDRGRGDYLASVDFEDIVRLIDGRERLVAEVAEAAFEVRDFIACEIDQMLGDENFASGVAGALMPDGASQARRPAALERFSALVVSPDS